MLDGSSATLYTLRRNDLLGPSSKMFLVVVLN